jgi:hypothetical protein
MKRNPRNKWLVILLTLVVATFMVLPSMLFADGVGNAQTECSNAAGCTCTYDAYKIDSNMGWESPIMADPSTFYTTDKGIEITVSNFQTKDAGSEVIGFDWATDSPVCCVIVKASNNESTVYGYSCDSNVDNGTAMSVEKSETEYYGISHVTFCFCDNGNGNGEPETGCITLYKYYEGPELAEGTEFKFKFNGSPFNLEQDGSRMKCKFDLDATYTLEELNDSNDDPHEVIIVDSNGTVLFEGSTPTGPIEITFDANASAEDETKIILYATNDPEEEPVEELGTIGIEKVDKAGKILTGAGFTLYNSDKSAVVRAEEMVDAAGKVAFYNLPIGTYIVSETTIPGGHSGMADTPVTINEGNVGTVINVKAVNTKTPPPGDGVEVQALTGEVEVLAFTGYNTIYYIIGFAMVIMGILGSLFLGRRLRREEK